MKALFIGLGSIGQRHLRNLKKLSPQIKISSYRTKKDTPLLSENNEIIYDQSIAQHYSLTEYFDLDIALDDEPDFIFITNPSKFHISTALKCLRKEAFIFIEKPLSVSIDKIDELKSLNNKYKTNKVAIGYQFRFHPGIKLIKTKLKELGNIVSCDFIYGEYLPDWHPYEDYRKSYAAKSELGGGAVLTLIHDFDLSLYLFGMPSKIYAIGDKLSSLEIDVEDSVKVIMKTNFQNKQIPISKSFDYLSCPSRRSINIVGDKGQINFDFKNNFLELNLLKERSQQKISFSDFNRNQMFFDEMKNFLEFVRGKESASVDLHNGINSLKIALGVKESIKYNKLISF